MEDLHGLLRLMTKSALERMLNTEMDVHLGRRPSCADVSLAGEVGNDTRHVTVVHAGREATTQSS